MARSFDELAKSTANGLGWRKGLLYLVIAAFAAMAAITPWMGVAQAHKVTHDPRPPCHHLFPALDHAGDHAPPVPCVN